MKSIATQIICFSGHCRTTFRFEKTVTDEIAKHNVKIRVFYRILLVPYIVSGIEVDSILNEKLNNVVVAPDGGHVDRRLSLVIG